MAPIPMPPQSTGSAARLAVSPSLLALAACASAGYYVSCAYDRHDKRDIDNAELGRAHAALDRLDRKLHENDSRKELLQHHMTNLDISGVTRIRSVLTKEAAEQWDETVCRQIAKNDGTCIVPAGGAVGRVHCKLFQMPSPQRRKGLKSGEAGSTSAEEVDRLYRAVAEVPERISGRAVSVERSNSELPSDGSASGIRLNDIAREYFAQNGIDEK
eukprot:4639296-Ditylum_brightwellii.AAC.1